MGGYAYTPTDWGPEAEKQWAAGAREAAIKTCLEALDRNPDPTADAFIQPGFYLFQLDRFDVGTQVLERGLSRFPDHPMILLSLGSSYSRWRKHPRAIPLLERFLAIGIIDTSAYDALAVSCWAMGDPIRARMFGTLALNEKDLMTKDRRGSLALVEVRDIAAKRKVIAFSLFGSHPRYLRGALHNVLAARSLFPGWTCRFIVDDSVDAAFCAVMAEEGAEMVFDDSGDCDVRHLLSRRFLVSDDPSVGYFMVRDCDSLLSPREAAAVTEWIDSRVPFHAMRDWISHTDPMLAGLWGGVAGMLPEMAAAIEQFRRRVPLNTNWDQFFLRDQVWPAIRDHILVHDRLFSTHAARPFPTATPPGAEHVGQNEFASDQAAQAAALAAYAERIPALALPRPVNLKFKLG
ncbi:MAG: tetratricopeptide repeat protein [Sphingomicrobium sp.]